MLAMLILVSSSSSFASCVSVFYPDVPMPYKNVIREIISGIKLTSTAPLEMTEVKQYLLELPKEKLRENHACQVTVGLGRSGLRVAKKLARPVIAGAIVSQPKDLGTVSGYSLRPSPDKVFERIRHFKPSIRSVFVVYNPENSDEVLSAAKKAGSSMGLTVNAYEASNLRAALRQYREMFEFADPEKNAIWVLQDPSTVDTNTILPFILKQAWRKKIMVISNHPSHVQHGVFFSVYPDNVSLGKKLGELSSRCVTGDCGAGKAQFLTQVLTAVNKRTAARLGINVSNKKDPFIDLVFPRR